MVDVAEDARVLAELDEDARNSIFDALQARMPQVWTSMRRDDPRESVVIVPSMTFDRVVGGSSGMSQSLEERFLFFLLLLRQPRLRLVYVTSQPINPLIVDYYLSLLPGVRINTSATDFAPIEQLQMMRFKGEKWDLFGDVISGEAGH